MDNRLLMAGGDKGCSLWVDRISIDQDFGRKRFERNCERQRTKRDEAGGIAKRSRRNDIIKEDASYRDMASNLTTTIGNHEPVIDCL